MKATSKQTLGEEIANSISHGLMAIFGIIAMVLLVLKSNSSKEVLGAVIFGMGMIVLYTMSTLFHALPTGTAKNVFQRMDHISIYMLIGGTFAPALLLIPGLNEKAFFYIGNLAFTKGIILFTVQWLLIIVGIVFKSIWIKKFQKLHIAIYLLMGWSSLMFLSELIAVSKEAFIYILLGGIAYSVGVIFYSLPKRKYYHFIWHIFTALGTIFQFISIYFFLY